MLPLIPLQSVPLSALDLGLETEAPAAVKQEPETVSTPALLNVRVRTLNICIYNLMKCNKGGRVIKMPLSQYCVLRLKAKIPVSC